jgi:hypothetical protein
MRYFEHLGLSCGLLLLACAGQVTVEGRSQGGSSSTATGGATAVVAPTTGGASSTLALGGNTASLDQSPPAPSYERTCIQAALEVAREAAGGSGANAGGASASVAGAPAAGSSSVNVSAADLGLGTGDLTVLVLFDKSGSMSDGWDERSKWQVANDSLMNALEPVVERP